MPNRPIGRTLFVALLLGATLAASSPASATTFFVGTEAELRTAINSAVGGDEIVLAGGIYTLPPGFDDAGLVGDYDINIVGTLLIRGAGADTTILDAGGAERLFDIAAGDLTLRGLTLTGGNPTGNPLPDPGIGGAIILVSGASVTLDDVTVRGNTGKQGGGIFSAGGAVTIIQSTVSGNTANGVPSGEGGGIHVAGAGTLTVINSTISGNSSATDVGGGIFVSGVGATVTILHSTIANNTATTGGGISLAAGTATLTNSILSNPAGGTAPDCDSTLATGGGNVVLSTAGCTILAGTNDKLDQDPQLGLLQNNGGRTETQAIGATSPALNNAVPSAVTVDQRGRSRASDSGAFEVTTEGFADTVANFARIFINDIIVAGVTAGCGGGNYCPGDPVTRNQMAAFLIRAVGETDGACTGAFTDVPCSDPFAGPIYRLVELGVTAGCAPALYCPTNPVTREQMAAFIIRTVERNNPAFTPPACTTPTFADVPCGSPFAPFVEDLVKRAVTAGCGGGNYCPGNSITRDQMAVFLAKAFGLPNSLQP